jgi:hypothetical protein
MWRDPARRAAILIGIQICCVSTDKFVDSEPSERPALFSCKDWTNSSPGKELAKQPCGLGPQWATSPFVALAVQMNPWLRLQHEVIDR